MGAAGLDLGHLGLNPSNSCYGLHFGLLADIVHRAGRAEFAAREDGADNDHDEGDERADDRADVQLAAVALVLGAAHVLRAPEVRVDREGDSGVIVVGRGFAWGRDARRTRARESGVVVYRRGAAHGGSLYERA